VHVLAIVSPAFRAALRSVLAGTHQHPTDRCPHNPDEACFIWKAGAPVAKGEEVCNSYGWLVGDEAFLQYGFLLPTPEGEVSRARCRGRATPRRL